jgi:hypothetical protein
MIFIGGVQPRSRRLESDPRTCPSCGAAKAYLKRTDHYISLFFIPLIPISRGQPMLACESCGGVFDERGQSVYLPSGDGLKRCLGCGERVEPSFTYCPYCGRRL